VKHVDGRLRLRAYTFAKRASDIVVALASLLITLPILLVTVMALWASMGPPAMFQQSRAGYLGRAFTLFKFRTMRGPKPGREGLDDEARLSAIGRFLRRTSIDELPQLVNVLRGEMSLVGPRPLLMEYLPLYTQEQARRHAVRPGITGWAQINGRNALSWDDKLAMDVWYVEHRSMPLDLRILAVTIWIVVLRSGISQDGHATAEAFRGSATPDSPARDRATTDEVSHE